MSDGKKCLWCLNEEPEITFSKKAHTIPKSLGGQNYNTNVCDSCNEYFGSRQYKYISIEGALKEAFNLSRFRLISASKIKRKVGEFKSSFFELKSRKDVFRVSLKDTIKYDIDFHNQLCRAFKRGLYKLYLEEVDRQLKNGFDTKYDLIRDFARYDKYDLPVFYFERIFGAIVLKGNEAETPILMFNRMKYLYSNDFFAEIEFLGHVFGFPISSYNQEQLNEYFSKSFELKIKYFKSVREIKRFDDLDLALSIMDN